MSLSLLILLQFAFADENFKDYDFTGLQREDNNPYTVDKGVYQFQWNFRKGFKKSDSTSCQSEDCIVHFVNTQSRSCMCFGDYSSEYGSIITSENCIKFTYKHKEKQEAEVSAEIYLYCSQNKTETAEDQTTRAVIKMYYPQGCKVEPKKDDPKKSQKKSLSFGSIMLIVISSLIVFLFLLGLLLNILVFKKRGIAVIPLLFFWTSLPGLMKDGLRFLFSPCISGKTGYSNQTGKL
ncbi:putative Autophagy-related protein 27 [Monocercomonoides exilis]|uniref:putative Autophagy-related protein 27 n=1 Tax=Monocercomonoides exilis TaxID=2049356 RepID=UPI0035596E4C|nr:putative Autophagy-related protein 27 [Monocercomonoides exilis]|eukprot:MONOS_2496.1-p1 / transcript=MONOS_2496.1 / gene=MONOS_2496 / organism=Monocercomonoides_exilis_PA203 / gene_product=unspecified product / transcript_product=unspecified product / location=Mono_scaffold00052:27888-28762(+) / protein_length=235 / sequence_SO=supercontig / SO=protein_coding / is_pseudo=false